MATSKVAIARSGRPAKQIVIVGDGEIAQLAYEYFTYDSPHKIVGFAVEREFLKRTDLFGVPVVDFEKMEAHFPPPDHAAFVAVSYVKLNRLRTRLYQLTKAKGYNCASYISSTARVWRDVELGENCLVLENSILQLGVAVGNNVIIGAANHIGHHCSIAANAFVTQGVVIAGRSRIGESCFIGSGSCIGDYVSVADDCVVGAGAVVLKDTEACRIYRGNPASAAKIDSFTAFNVKPIRE